MHLYDRLEWAWAEHGRFRSRYHRLTFTDRGIEVGTGVVLVKYRHDDWGAKILGIAGQEERILALLSAAWDHSMPDHLLDHFHNASRALSKGQLAQACIHLAFTGLQPLDHDSDTFRLLFIADALLDAGFSGNEIRKAWGLGRSNFCKFNHNHYPAGDGRGGQFAPKDGGGEGFAQTGMGIQNVDYKIEGKMPPPSPQTARQRIVLAAEKQEGSVAWDFSVERGQDHAGTNKCNLFVAEMLTEAGIPVPNMSGGVPGFRRYPPLAGQWADPNVEIPGWTVLSPGTPPQPGDVVAVPMIPPVGHAQNYTGHVGIVVAKKTGDGIETMSVSSEYNPERVQRSNFGFRSGEHPVFRRYVGPGASI